MVKCVNLMPVYIAQTAYTGLIKIHFLEKYSYFSVQLNTYAKFTERQMTRHMFTRRMLLLLFCSAKQGNICMGLKELLQEHGISYHVSLDSPACYQKLWNLP